MDRRNEVSPSPDGFSWSWRVRWRPRIRSMSRALLAGFLAILAATPAGARSFPPASPVGHWKAPENQARLRIQWTALPKSLLAQKGEGSPLKAPLFLLVVGEDTRLSRKIETSILGDTRVVLALQNYRAVRLRPERVPDLPWLESATVKDPTIAIVGRDGALIAMLTKRSEFEGTTRCLKLLSKGVVHERPAHLADHLHETMGLLEQTEEIWKQKRRLAKLEERAAKLQGDKRTAALAEAHERKEGLRERRETLSRREQEVRDRWDALIRKAAKSSSRSSSD